MDRALKRGESSLGPEIAPMLEGVVATLRSGGSLRAGLDRAAERGSLGPTMRSLLARADAGIGLRDALASGARAQQSRELRFAMAAMTLAIDTGAAQAPALDAVAQRVRERVALQREIAAASAAARASAMIVAGAPIAFGVLVLLVDPSVISAALRTGAGRTCMPVGGMLEALGIWWMRRLAGRPLRDDHQDAITDLPEAVDLLALTMAAGARVPAALRATAPHVPGEAGRALRTASARLEAGAALVDALADWPDRLGDPVRPLVAALLAAHHDGAPAGAALERLAIDLRHLRRQRALVRVHRLPVLLLFPLVCCVLPAFVLLTVIPLALGALGVLRA